MLESYINRFVKYFESHPNMIQIFEIYATRYLANGDTNFIKKCEFACLSNAQETIIDNAYYHELAEACLTAIERRA